MNLKHYGLLLPDPVNEIVSACPGYSIARDSAELVALACGAAANDTFDVSYDIPEVGTVCEAQVCRVRNGIAVNYVDPYMRRRDPDCMLIADDSPTDKPRFSDRFGMDFGSIREETFNWLKEQELLLFPFTAGSPGQGLDAVVVAPANAGFFALALALLQGIHNTDAMPGAFTPRAVIYVAPPFRHTHFGGKQIVVHRRLESLYEMFSYNLYPGPSAKKGVYGMLIDLGEQEKWITAHGSTVQVVTPYDNKITIMHEGASGGGKSGVMPCPKRPPSIRLLRI